MFSDFNGGHQLLAKARRKPEYGLDTIDKVVVVVRNRVLE